MSDSEAGSKGNVPEKPAAGLKNPRKRNRPGKGSKDRRQDDYRRRMNKQVLADTSNGIGRAAMDAKYMALGDSLNLKLSSASIAPKPTTALLPITSWSVGLNVVASYNEALRVAPDRVRTICTLTQAYRACLAQFTYKVMKAEENRKANFPVPPVRADIYLTPDITSLLDSYRHTFPLLVNVFSAVGWFEHNSCCFQTAMLTSQPHLSSGSPFDLNATNLRSVCVDLANGAAHAAAFIRVNPIPGAKYVNNRLVNLDEVVPPDWPSRALVRSDVEALTALLSFVSSKRKDYNVGFNYEPPAMPHSLVWRNCSQASEVGVLTTADDGSCSFTTKFDTMWLASHHIDTNLWVRGILADICVNYSAQQAGRIALSSTEVVTADWDALAKRSFDR